MEERLIRVEEGLKTVAEDLNDIKSALKDIASSLKTLAVLEEKHNAVSEAMRRAFKSIKKNTERIDSIEKALPELLISSSWVFKAVIYVMALLGVGAIGTLLKSIIKF
ncbi:MAG: hypothetical protein HY954_13305 [Deltaproteobacteria bacterium]|nr:hypothetical protein [Deltaproteobacteria bacterium]